ncbi:Low-affinity glucose transporter hxt3 [Brettanomyces bruxellensis]|uniref:Low-affinity glucose transporter hxt3 n=1 Tax=Dekkera bruxellensis TaxID=5007 RepID=A0A871RD42_DEKBR|nr:Low-affinity glucose transporter hxt3 [Brettanomyces bruxellensis]QOU20030.1 Low-affinity glucose transporter hxt3 [Brettanomyces bruxellensis]
MSSSEISSKQSNQVANGQNNELAGGNPDTFEDRTQLKQQLDQAPVEPVAAPVENKSSYLFAGVMCLLIAFGGFVFGWDTGTISGFVNMPDFLKRFGQWSDADNEYYLSKVRTGLIVSIFNIGCAFGGVTLAKTGDIYGRKKGLMVTMVIYIVGIIIQIASVKSWVQYFIGRIVSGFAVGSISILCPMFISETSPKAIRGACVSCYQLMITLGIFLGYCTDYGTYHNYDDSRQWRIPLGLCFAWALFMIFGMTLMPESPRFLVEKKRMEEAKKSVGKVNKCAPDSDFTLQEVNRIIDAIETEALAGNASWGELFTGKPKIFYRLSMGIMLQSLQQLTGDNYFFYYGTTIFKSVGLTDSFETSIILGIVNFASTFPSLYIVDRFGRRWTLLAGCVGMLVCLVIFASLGVKTLYKGAYGVDPNTSAGDAMIFLACLYIFFFATTWGPTVFVVVSETYPLRIRAKGMGLAQSANWLWGFLIAFFTPFITGAIHFAYGYVFFGCVVFAFFYVATCVPETKGLSLEDVDEIYRHFTPGTAFLSKFSNAEKAKELAEEEETAQKA